MILYWIVLSGVVWNRCEKIMDIFGMEQMDKKLENEFQMTFFQIHV